MVARIYKPARNAMQSGTAKTHDWILEFAPADARFLDPLMGWIGSDDMDSQVTLRFGTQDEAIAYATRHGIAYQLSEPKPRAHVLRQNGYGDNFSTQRRAPWTH